MVEEDTGAKAEAGGGRTRPRRYVIVGGGIAGVTAAEELLDLLEAEEERGGAEGPVEVTLLTATRAVKQVGRVVKVTRKLEEVDVVERDADDLARGRRNLRVVLTRVTGVDAHAHVAHCQDGSKVPFDRCLIATGAAPKLVSAHPNVVGIRDTESVQDLARRLAAARRVLVVGNGGIALEVVHEVVGCELVWAVKDGYVGNTFFDSTASGFVLPQLQQRRPVRVVNGQARAATTAAVGMMDDAVLPPTTDPKRGSGGAGGGGGEGGPAMSRRPPEEQRTPTAPRIGESESGGALGPDWTASLAQAAAAHRQEGTERGAAGAGVDVGVSPLTILFHVELEALLEASPKQGQGLDEAGWPLFVRLSNGQTWGCDFVVSATGVVPVVGFLGPEYARGEDGGVVVNERMQTTAGPDVFAAGDCCSMTWPESDVWFQMRLWTQARTMARYAARCMAEQVDELGSGFAFELFAHMTRFFGFPVALLGCFNAQQVGDADQRRLVQEVRVVQRVVAGKGRHQQGQQAGEGEATEEEGETVKLEGPALGGEAPTPAAEAAAAEAAATGTGTGTAGPGAVEGPAIEVLTRLTPGVEYVKVVVVRGRVKGAMLVGEGTELAETFENLILDQTDVSPYGVDLLDPDIDIDDYFD